MLLSGTVSRALNVISRFSKCVGTAAGSSDAEADQKKSLSNKVRFETQLEPPEPNDPVSALLGHTE